MHFTITETAYDLPIVENDAEITLQRHYESKGYSVLNNTFSVLFRSKTTKYPEYAEKVDELFDREQLEFVDDFLRAIYPGDGVSGVAPGHPDLLVYKEDKSEMFFCEVKQGNQDRLTVNEMIGISLIHAFLACRIEVARLNGRVRSYRWIWPAFQQLHPEKTVDLSH